MTATAPPTRSTDATPSGLPSQRGALARALAEHPFARFLLAGGANTALGFVLFHALIGLYHGFHAAAGLAQATSYAIGIAVSYGVNRRWTFRSTGGHGTELPRFVAAHLGSLALSSLLLQGGVSLLGLLPTVCWVLVTGVTTVLNFVMQRHFVFAPTGDRAPR